jgi:hypothetical protein
MARQVSATYDFADVAADLHQLHDRNRILEAHADELFSTVDIGGKQGDRCVAVLPTARAQGAVVDGRPEPAMTVWASAVRHPTQLILRVAHPTDCRLLRSCGYRVGRGGVWL